MSLTNNLLRFSQSLILMFAAVVACVLAFSYYALARDTIRSANAERLAALQLTQELRQSSDDLTRMVRTYVATSEVRYRNQYDEILAIREGLAPRPLEYEILYWDLVLDERRPTSPGAAAPLLQRMAAAGFTEEELNRLNVAKQSSDRLVAIERQAMALVDVGSDTPGGVAAEQRMPAIRMLHDDRYHRTKADIMRPIAEAIRMSDARTTEVVATADQQALWGLGILAFSSVILLLTLWWSYRNLQLVMGGSVSQLHDTVLSMDKPDALATTTSNNMDSIIGKLVNAQQTRITEESRRKDYERALSEAERRLYNIVGALDEGVCVVQDALIRLVNPKLQEVMEMPETELVDHPFIQFVHHEDRVAMMERYRKRSGGKALESDSEFRIRTGKGAILSIKCRAAEFEWAGRPATLYILKTA